MAISEAKDYILRRLVMMLFCGVFFHKTMNTIDDREYNCKHVALVS
jgi:hypothetical protein